LVERVTADRLDVLKPSPDHFSRRSRNRKELLVISPADANDER
jgi:hypothetical protein